MNSSESPELAPESTTPDFNTSFEGGFFLAMKVSETRFSAVTSDGKYSFEFDAATPHEPQYISTIEDSSDIDRTIGGYQEKAILNCMHTGSYPLPEPIPTEFRKAITIASVAAHLLELDALMKTQEYKNRVQSIFDTWNEE